MNRLHRTALFIVGNNYDYFYPYRILAKGLEEKRYRTTFLIVETIKHKDPFSSTLLRKLTYLSKCSGIILQVALCLLKRVDILIVPHDSIDPINRLVSFFAYALKIKLVIIPLTPLNSIHSRMRNISASNSIFDLLFGLFRNPIWVPGLYNPKSKVLAPSQVMKTIFASHLDARDTHRIGYYGNLKHNSQLLGLPCGDKPRIAVYSPPLANNFSSALDFTHNIIRIVEILIECHQLKEVRISFHPRSTDIEQAIIRKIFIKKHIKLIEAGTFSQKSLSPQILLVAHSSSILIDHFRRGGIIINLTFPLGKNNLSIPNVRENFLSCDSLVSLHRCINKIYSQPLTDYLSFRRFWLRNYGATLDYDCLNRILRDVF